MKQIFLFIFIILINPAATDTLNSSTSFSFAQISDIHYGDTDSSLLKKVVSKINNSHVDFTLISGDLVHFMSYSLYPSLKETLSRLDKPWYAVPGNHDVGMHPSKKSLSIYRDLYGDDYFFISHKQSLFIFVNTQLFLDDVNEETIQQTNWLHKIFETSNNKFENIFVIGHKPLFVDSINEKYNPNVNIAPKIRTTLIVSFSTYGVTAYFNGHLHKSNAHLYKKTAFLSQESIDCNGGSFRIWYAGKRNDFLKINNLDNLKKSESH